MAHLLDLGTYCVLLILLCCGLVLLEIRTREIESQEPKIYFTHFSMVKGGLHHYMHYICIST